MSQGKPIEFFHVERSDPIARREREPWFDPAQSYNPALHRIKQALFHAAVVPDLNTHPLPLPHAELLKYFEPPPKVIKRAESAIKDCIAEFKVQQGMLSKCACNETFSSPIIQLSKSSEGDERKLMPRRTMI